MTATQTSATDRPGRQTHRPPLARRALAATLSGLGGGCLEIHDAYGTLRLGETSATALEPIRIHVREPSFYRSVLANGTLGAAESWMRGEWSCDELTALIRLFIRSRAVMRQLDARWVRIGSALQRVGHALRRNSRTGARRNIHRHYDLGNDFFELFLDPSLTYSCGVFEHGAASLEEASIAKYDRLCRTLHLGPGDRVLEIGCGWGGFAIHAASKYGCHVTATTISEQQYAMAADRIARQGLSDRVTLLLEDYRDLSGTYDKLVSIEMIEAVGHQYFDTYFRTCSERLASDGLFGLQAIVIRDQHYERAARNVDFIKRYIFPGGDLPSLAKIADCVARVTNLRIVGVEDLTPHYARTLREWRKELRRNTEKIRELGYGPEFLRMWEFYFAYCEAGFLERNIGCQQIALAKPQCQLGSVGPL